MGEPFEAVVGAEHVTAAEHSTGEADGGVLPDGTRVCAVVRPADAEQVAACLRVAGETERAVVARGGGSKLAWGNPVSAPAVVCLDLGRLDAAVDFDPDEGVARVGAGLALDRLAARCEAAGKTSLLDPLFSGATVGGTVAADPLGPENSLERRLRDDLLGLEVALADGTLTRCGGQVVKNVSGFDLTRLYCGSLGTLGVITAASVRLRARPECRSVWVREFAAADGGPDSAVALAFAYRQGGAPLAAVAVLPEANGAARALWLYAGPAAGAAECAARAPGEAADESWAETARRRVAHPGEGRARVRCGARPSDTAALSRTVADVAGADAPRLLLPLAGTVFANVPCAALGALFEQCAQRGWIAFLEEAPPETRAMLDAFGPPDETLVLMRQLKQRFDPARRLAPGRFWGRL